MPEQEWKDTVSGKHVSGNYLLEGYTTGRSVTRSIRLRIQPGGTPNTNINVSEIGNTVQYNIPAISNATNLAAGGTSGSFSLSADGAVITMDITPEVIGILSSNIIYHDLNSSSVSDNYYPLISIASGNMTIALSLQGTSSAVDLRTILDAGDLTDVMICFVTSS